MDQNRINGVFTALITPFTQGAVDYEKLAELVERQISAGVAGLVPVGTTGESPTLDNEEHIAVIAAVVRASRGRVPVIAGTGANSTREALDLTKAAEAAGADAFLQVAPYYNKPTQEGLFQHFRAIAGSTDKPIVLYSIPGRCGVEIAVSTVQRLLEACPNVRSIKEAGGTVSRVNELRAACGTDLTILCGDDGLTVPFIASGAKGIVSVASNLAPQVIVSLTRAALEGRFADAEAQQRTYFDLLTDLVFLEGNPVTIKEAMAQKGLLASAEVRLPLVPASEGTRLRIAEVLARLEIA